MMRIQTGHLGPRPRPAGCRSRPNRALTRQTQPPDQSFTGRSGVNIWRLFPVSGQRCSTLTWRREQGCESGVPARQCQRLRCHETANQPAQRRARPPRPLCSAWAASAAKPAPKAFSRARAPARGSASAQAVSRVFRIGQRSRRSVTGFQRQLDRPAGTRTMVCNSIAKAGRCLRRKRSAALAINFCTK